MTKPLVWIEWLDSCHTYGWHDEEEFARTLKVISVGFLHRDSDDAVMLTMTRDENDRWSNSITIPKSAITLRKTIPVQRSHKRKRK